MADTISSRKSSVSSSRLAVPAGADYGSSSLRSAGRPTQYLARLVDMQQMDVQSALDQMKSLLGSRPHTVYKTAYYRKQTKNHWARDDPAFCAIQLVVLVVSAISYSVAFKASLSTFVSFLIHSVLWNWLVSGAIVSSILREIANRHLASTQSSAHVRQSVEWLYAFDIHCNAFFPLFCVLCTFMLLLLLMVLLLLVMVWLMVLLLLVMV
ncbi:MAG: unc-50 family protein [Myxococcota bacterium]